MIFCIDIALTISREQAQIKNCYEAKVNIKKYLH